MLIEEVCLTAPPADGEMQCDLLSPERYRRVTLNTTRVFHRGAEGLRNWQRNSQMLEKSGTSGAPKLLLVGGGSNIIRNQIKANMLDRPGKSSTTPGSLTTQVLRCLGWWRRGNLARKKPASRSIISTVISTAN